MAKELCFGHYQPLSFCKSDCAQMKLNLNQSELFGDNRLVERVVVIICDNEAVCKAARQRTFEEIQKKMITKQNELE